MKFCKDTAEAEALVILCIKKIYVLLSIDVVIIDILGKIVLCYHLAGGKASQYFIKWSV